MDLFQTDSLFSPIPANRTLNLPSLIERSGIRATERFLEFFTVTIRNANTRRAYARQVIQFLYWCETYGIRDLKSIRPIMVARYVEQRLKENAEPQSVKQALAAIRMLFDWLVIGQVVETNPATSVRGPKYSVKRGKTPVLDAKQARNLLESIDVGNIIGLRDRALIAIMIYSFARIGAVVGMNARDYYPDGKRWWIRLHEKGGKLHEIPVHHEAEQYLDSYIKASQIEFDPESALFRTSRGRTRKLTENRLCEREALAMVKRRAKAAGLPSAICCHTFRATGITVYLKNGGTIENAQAIAAHESPRTTKLYDRRSDQIALDEIERIRL